MRGSFVKVSMMLGVLTAPLAAQGVDPNCENPAYVGAGLEGGNACQQAMDTYAYATQQYATLLSGGNMEIGSADALGGFPKFRVALHFTGMNLVAPALRASGIAPGPAVSSTITTQGTDFVIIAADGMLGLFGGIDLGIAKFGAVDAFVSLNLVPGATAAGYTVTPKSKVYLGYGARVGVMQETKVLPGVGVSYFVRNMPSTTVIATDVFQNAIYVTDLKVDTKAWSATVGKHFGIVSLLVGAGQTTFNSTAGVSWAITGSNGTIPGMSASSTQTQYFGDFGVKIGGTIDLVLEVGEVTGSELQTFNTFDPASTASRTFASFAITFGH